MLTLLRVFEVMTISLDEAVLFMALFYFWQSIPVYQA